ncbi:MAG TPA: alpha/beta fold hydrolase [Gemmatimonadaceae bacterium]|nr:alpha/beta fold hydrolase [Gemmatimonadaceae bacterium]
MNSAFPWRGRVARTGHARRWRVGSTVLYLALPLLPAAVGGQSASAPAAQQGGRETVAAYVFLVGDDTLGVERYTRTPSRLTGDVALRGQPRLVYDVPVVGDTAFGPMSLVVYGPGASADAAPLQRALITMMGDTAIAEVMVNGSSRLQKIASQANALPMVNQSAAMFELAVARWRQAGSTTAHFPIFFTAGGQTLPTTMTAVTSDSVEMVIGPQHSSMVVDSDGRVIRIHTPSQRLTIVRVTGEAARGISLARPDYSAPADAPYRALEVAVPTPEGHTLAGTLTVPIAASGRVPAVVTITGSGAQDRDESIPFVPGFRPFRQVADTLGRRGIAVLRLDDRGYGGSGGNAATSTTADYANDIRAAVAWLRERPEIDPARIALVGHSEGGMIAPMVAATDSSLAGIVLMAGPAKSLGEIIPYQIRYAVDHDTSFAPAARDSIYQAQKAIFDSTAARTPWMRFGLPYDPLPTARQVSVPVLIMQGATDRQVTADQADALATAIRSGGNTDVTVLLLPAHNHLFLPDPDGNPAGYVRLAVSRLGPETLGPIADWLVAHMKP